MVPVQGRHLHLSAQQGRKHIYRRFGVQIIVAPLEGGMRQHLNAQIHIAALPAPPDGESFTRHTHAWSPS